MTVSFSQIPPEGVHIGVPGERARGLVGDSGPGPGPIAGREVRPHASQRARAPTHRQSAPLPRSAVPLRILATEPQTSQFPLTMLLCLPSPPLFLRAISLCFSDA